MVWFEKPVKNGNTQIIREAQGQGYFHIKNRSIMVAIDVNIFDSKLSKPK